MHFIVSLFTTYLPYFVLVLTLLVFVHEFGQYWVGRRFGIHRGHCGIHCTCRADGGDGFVYQPIVNIRLDACGDGGLLPLPLLTRRGLG